ncbi:hypothetical protein X975_08884, partial [Stegodyphus mimosarum]
MEHRRFRLLSSVEVEDPPRTSHSCTNDAFCPFIFLVLGFR